MFMNCKIVDFNNNGLITCLVSMIVKSLLFFSSNIKQKRNRVVWTHAAFNHF